MTRSKKILLFPLMLIALALCSVPLLAGTHEEHRQHAAASSAHSAEAAEDFAAMPEPGEKVPIGNDNYLIYGFDREPEMGTLILRVEVYDPDGKKIDTLEVLADAGMPSMRGAHETGDQPLRLSKKGAYLLPVNIVMPGDWEIRLTLKEEGRVLFRGSHRFDI